MLSLYICLALVAATLAGLTMRYFSANRYKNLLVIIVAALLSISITKAYVVPHYLAYSFAESIRNASPLVDLIAKTSPDEFNQYVRSVQENIINNRGSDDISLNTNNLISLMLIKNIPNASNESIYRYLSVCLQMDKELLRADPRYVLFVEYPGTFTNQITSANILQNVKPETITELLAAKQAIIESALENRQPNLSLADRLKANFVYSDILSNLSHQYGRKMMIDAFHNPDGAHTDHQRAAEVIIKYYEDILAKGPDGAGVIYKSLFSGK